MVVLTTLFFMWGFMTVMNDILVPHLKAVFTLNYTQSMLVQFCFFGAYFLGSLAYFLVSRSSGDPLQRMGYSFWAESSYKYIMPKLRRLQECLGLSRQQLTFFIAHSDIDAKHAEEIERERVPEVQVLLERRQIDESELADVVGVFNLVLRHLLGGSVDDA